MLATAWLLEKNNDEFLYQMQIDGIFGKREKNKALKTVKDWDICGEGFNTKTKEFIIILVRNFSSSKDWLTWAKNYPFNLKELNRNGKPKPLKLGAEASKKKTRK